jgi:hypothetical protein
LGRLCAREIVVGAQESLSGCPRSQESLSAASVGPGINIGRPRARGLVIGMPAGPGIVVGASAGLETSLPPGIMVTGRARNHCWCIRGARNCLRCPWNHHQGLGGARGQESSWGCYHLHLMARGGDCPQLSLLSICVLLSLAMFAHQPLLSFHRNSRHLRKASASWPVSIELSTVCFGSWMVFLTDRELLCRTWQNIGTPGSRLVVASARRTS